MCLRLVTQSQAKHALFHMLAHIVEFNSSYEAIRFLTPPLPKVKS